MTTRRRAKSTRPTPGPEQLDRRAERLRELKVLTPDSLLPTSPEGLEPGNRKTGQFGSRYHTVLVWNLPAVGTCPGASDWCLGCCYNADPRTEVFPVDRWKKNWGWYISNSSALRSRILSQLAAAAQPCAVRIHSSGDFFSNDYIRFWIDIIRHARDTRFWGYTRSWRIDDLRPALEELRTEPNMQLFASWDDTMPPAPAGWRTSVVVDVTVADAASLPPLVCPEQTGARSNCASCGFCLEPHPGNVTFFLH